MSARPDRFVPPRLPAANADPYAAPAAELRADASGNRLYSPLQVSVGAFLGGPVGLAYFLWANFRALANEQAARRTLAAGAALMVALIVTLPILPDRFPSWPITVLYMVTGRYVAERFQMTKQAIEYSADYTFHSGWRVFGIGLSCLVVSLVLIVVPIVALALLGIWDPMGLANAA